MGGQPAVGAFRSRQASLSADIHFLTVGRRRKRTDVNNSVASPRGLKRRTPLLTLWAAFDKTCVGYTRARDSGARKPTRIFGVTRKRLQLPTPKIGAGFRLRVSSAQQLK